MRTRWSSFTGPVRREAVRRRFEAALATSGALASVVFVFAAITFVRVGPNVGALPRNSEFDAERVFADLKRLVSFGPRLPGSHPLEQSREFIFGEISTAGAAVDLGSFTASTPLGSIPMTNLVAKIFGTSSAVVITILPFPPPFLADTAGWRHSLRPGGAALVCFPPTRDPGFRSLPKRLAGMCPGRRVNFFSVPPEKARLAWGEDTTYFKGGPVVLRQGARGLSSRNLIDLATSSLLSSAVQKPP
jgi:hypothetical protein